MDGVGDSDLLKQLQALLLPEKVEEGLDRRALGAKLRLLADLCESDQEQEGPQEPSVSTAAASRKKARREFDYEAYRTRFVAMQVFYLGWDYSGFAAQDCGKTIENALIQGLKRTKLIPEHYKNARQIQYSKCGRTDKGVSALGQVISLMVRSKRKLNEEEASVEEEFDYATMLNAVLPPEIRVWGWAPVQPDFSARFSTRSREYKYFLVIRGSDDIDVALMQESCQRFKGLHNFRNFCKMNLDYTTNHERVILDISIDPVENISFPRTALYVVRIKGSAFLWHQVRCMVHVLLLVGRRLESPEVIDALLDTEQTPAKPLYDPAAEVPLVLWEADYGDVVVPFRRSHCQLQKNRALLEDNIRRHFTQLLILHHIYETLQALPHDGDRYVPRTSAHVPLLQRRREPSFDERMAKREQRSAT